MDLDEEDNEEITVNRHPVVGDANGLAQPIEDIQPKDPSKPSSYSTSKSKLSVQDNNNNINEQQQPGDEWEEFDDMKSTYDRLRLKFQRSTHEDNENEEDYSDDENTHRTNFDENYNGFDDIDGERTSRNNKQQKDKPAWNLDQVKQPATVDDQPAEKIDEQPSAPVPVKPATTGAYRPPQLRGNSAVTVVSTGTQQRGSKKEKPNLASTEEFPTLGAAVNKK